MYQSGKATSYWNYSLWARERRTSGKRIRGCAWDVTHAVSMQPAGSSSLGLFSCPYSPECVEGEFCEVRRHGVLRSCCWTVASSHAMLSPTYQRTLGYAP